MADFDFDNENKPLNTDDIIDIAAERKDALDDEQRVKVLSPTMLVLKRFFRNKLAIAGLIIISLMFLFSFVGGFITPYGEQEVFYEEDFIMSDYASGSYNKEYKFDSRDNLEFASTARAQFVLALNSKRSTFDANNHSYFIVSLSNKTHLISELVQVANQMSRIGRDLNYTLVNDEVISEELEDTIVDSLLSGNTEFKFGNDTYVIKSAGKVATLWKTKDLAIASQLIYDVFVPNTVIDYDFKVIAETAFISGDSGTFTVGDKTYSYEANASGYLIYLIDGENKTEFALVSDFIVTPDPSINDKFLTIDFKNILRKAVEEDAKEFNALDFSGEEIHFELTYKDNLYIAKRLTLKTLIDQYASPSKEHWLGIDFYGMDILTRLMYGGRVSLTIGFIVIAIEIVIGVILGGIAGYFGKWVDSLIMRIVDIFNCIPTLPIIIIIGAMMDERKIDPKIRIVWLMIIMGVLGWPGIARMVRGQILSLREQEFMIAAEATGISISRRIFRHLVPNVIPQLIVIATMGLGGIILTESTLSFLGIGVKWPLASWGNIISDVTKLHVMRNYWFVWIPAGFLILITVMGFNFIGDGLRDAFDPKMKR